jgi:hypothetical protein
MCKAVIGNGHVNADFTYNSAFMPLHTIAMKDKVVVKSTTRKSMWETDESSVSAPTCPRKNVKSPNPT